MININTLEWNVFFKVIDNKPLEKFEEFKIYEKIFGKRYPMSL